MSIMTEDMRTDIQSKVAKIGPGQDVVARPCPNLVSVLASRSGDSYL